jgi:hypothetical protein
MKTIAVFYKKATVVEDFGKEAKEIVCKTTTDAEHWEIRNNYLKNPEFCKSLSFCWHLPDEESERIFKLYEPLTV